MAETGFNQGLEPSSSSDGHSSYAVSTAQQREKIDAQQPHIDVSVEITLLKCTNWTTPRVGVKAPNLGEATDISRKRRQATS